MLIGQAFGDLSVGSSHKCRNPQNVNTVSVRGSTDVKKDAPQKDGAVVARGTKKSRNPCLRSSGQIYAKFS